MKYKPIIAKLLAAGLLGVGAAQAATINVSSDIAAGTSETWYSTNEYLLTTMIYVETNATLTIEPGTVVKGATNATSRPGIPNPVSGLWVTRGGKLYATGTVDKPIIMTFEGDDVNDPNDVAYDAMGKWGGLVLLGKARINSSSDAGGQAASPKYDVYEGTTGAGTISEHIFGGNDDTDSSGELRYLSIRYPGSVFAPAKEINGLTMGGVGSGTVIEYVEVLNSQDDGYEWWGGVVNTKHLVAAFCDDDDFDTDQGYRGTNQFWFGIKPPWTGSSDSRGFENDGDLDQGVTGELPLSEFSAYNVTLVGRGQGETAFGGGYAQNPRDEAYPWMYDSVVTEFASWLKVDDPAGGGVGNAIVNAASVGTVIAPFTTNNITFGDPLLGGISYTNDAGLNPRPIAGSPALGITPVAGAPETVDYYGAFGGAADDWADGWTALSQMGYLTPADPVIAVGISEGQVNVGVLGLQGYTYQLQSRTSLNSGGWLNDGDPKEGTGGIIVFTKSTTVGEEFFQVVRTKQ